MSDVKVIERPMAAPVDNEATGPILKRWGRVLDGAHLDGFIYGDSRFPDGEFVTTTRIAWINEEAGLAQTKNTLYLLRDKR